MSKKILIVIPARYQSTRLPGKPLVKIAGVEMIKRVAQIADFVSKNNENCSYVVATDDNRIVDFCSKENIPVTTEEYGLSKAKRPLNSRLDTSKLSLNGFVPLPSWNDALKRYIKELKEND